MIRSTRCVLGLAVLALALPVGAARADNIRVQSTTDTVDAGLVEGLLRNAYTAAQPGDTFDYTAVGTGKALDNARLGLGDVVITHAPSLEADFVRDGFSLEPYGRAIFYSDYVIVGPTSDPAGVLGGAPHDAIGALEAIAAAGAAGKATFLSRGDNSGTNVQEQLMWGMTTTVPKKAAGNASGNPDRFEPGVGEVGKNYPAWYAVSGLKGQGLNVQETDVCPARYPNGGCYTMTDRGTFNRLINSQTVTRLKVVSEKNAPSARGGENLLINPFSAYIVNPAKFADPSKFNVAGATRFVDFLTSEGFQRQVESFPSLADPAFRPGAFPAITQTVPANPVAAAGSTIAYGLTASSRLPGGGVIDGLPVQLQRSTDDGATWTNAGPEKATDGAGLVTFTTQAAVGTSRFRVSLPRYRQFSPTTVQLGVVTVKAAAPPTDTARPATTKVKLSAKRLTFSLSEAATVRVTIGRRATKRVGQRGKTKTVVSYQAVKRFTLKATRAGTASRAFRALRSGTYKVTLVATDAAGNVQTKTSTLKLRP